MKKKRNPPESDLKGKATNGHRGEREFLAHPLVLSSPVFLFTTDPPPPGLGSTSHRPHQAQGAAGPSRFGKLECQFLCFIFFPHSSKFSVEYMPASQLTKSFLDNKY
jgi:hypothetical protein